MNGAKLRILALVVLGSLPLKAAMASESQELSIDDLRARIVGSTMEYTSPIDTPVRWTNEPDGTTVVRFMHDRKRGMSHDAISPGEWSISESGKYCLTEHRDTAHGGVLHWCAPISVATDGSMSIQHGNSLIAIHK
jgi:hypothetical protein